MRLALILSMGMLAGCGRDRPDTDRRMLGLIAPKAPDRAPDQPQAKEKRKVRLEAFTNEPY